jgi:hypothetical protein
METIQTANLNVQAAALGQRPGRGAGWASLVVFLCWILALAGVFLASQAFPGTLDQFNPAKIQNNIVMASLGWFLQIALGTAYVALALLLSDYLAKPMTKIVRFALVGGLVGGIFLVAAGAGGQENVFMSVFTTPEQKQEQAQAIGAPDLSVLTMANSIAAGGMRSTSAYGQGWAMVLWGIAALKGRKLPAVLCWIQMITGLLYGLTVWIGPIVGPVAFIGMLVGSLWMGIFLLRVKQTA